jgi:hypothetical protein
MSWLALNSAGDHGLSLCLLQWSGWLWLSRVGLE